MLDSDDIANETSEDCNENGVPDECDIANWAEDCDHNGVPDGCQATHIGDMDFSAVIDLGDVPGLEACMTGPCESAACVDALGTDPCCDLVDFDSDGDIDLADFAIFQLMFGT